MNKIYRHEYVICVLKPIINSKIYVNNIRILKKMVINTKKFNRAIYLKSIWINLPGKKRKKLSY